jgi:hypothetical protein
MLSALPPSLSGMFMREMGELEMGAEDVDELFASAVNIIGTPFIQKCVVILDPLPVVTALQAISEGTAGGEQGSGDVLDRLLEEAEKTGMTSGGIGRIRVDVLNANQAYPSPRLTLPVVMKDMDPGPPPVTKADVPFLPGVTVTHNGRTSRGDFLLDTGGGVSLLSPRLARELGVNLAAPQITAQVQGVGPGAGGLNGYWIDQLAVNSTGGGVRWTRVPLFVADIAGIDGSLGMNLLGPSVYLNLKEIDMSNPLGILGEMRSGPLPFRRIVIDLPHRRLGLDPA